MILTENPEVCDHCATKFLEEICRYKKQTVLFKRKALNLICSLVIQFQNQSSQPTYFSDLIPTYFSDLILYEHGF